MQRSVTSTLPVSSMLHNYHVEMESELTAILDYWATYTVDEMNGGFHGSIDHQDRVIHGAPRGIVMYSRVCWAFSAGYGHTGNQRYLQLAQRAVDYISDHFPDLRHGGVYWSTDQDGRPLDDKKQIYGLAFCIYGFAEYYRVTHEERVLEFCRELFQQIEKYSFDPIHGGYIEAFARDWKPLSDLRLSDKDDNASKTMNSHLHILEAYANLYSVWPDALLRDKIAGLLELFSTRFFNRDTNHFNLFFDDKWNSVSMLISYGHDIEAAWLLQQCAEVARLTSYSEEFRRLVIPVTNAALEGVDDDGGLWYEYDQRIGLIQEKHWWPQAEAMIGFLNAYQVTQDPVYLHHSIASWSFIKKDILDPNASEWHWGVYKDYSTIKKDKAGFWKCPYHNTRACLEILQRIKIITHE